MPARLQIRPITKTFTLSRLDPTGETTVTIRQARSGDLIKLGDLFAEQTQIWDDEDVGTVKLQKKWNPHALMRERAYVTLVACDIEDSEGKPLFQSRESENGTELAMSRGAFLRAWDALPPEWADEIYEYVVEVNPNFDPSRAGE